jgi:hypothetical protein
MLSHLAFLLDTPVGRDFNLITAAGVEFKVHSMMLIGGSKFIQEGLFPGGVSHCTPFKSSTQSSGIRHLQPFAADVYEQYN